MRKTTPPFVVIKDLKKHFSMGDKIIPAVDDVSFDIHRGETLAVVGESGSGKTTLARTLLYLETPTSGSILFEGKDLSSFPRLAFRRKAQMVFQDPSSSLNPRMTVQEIITEPLVIHAKAKRKQLPEEAKKLLLMVGLETSMCKKFPHEFSGGQRQRIGIARALALRPEFLILDEPISSLDISIQAQIINLLIDLQEKLSLTYLFISHDLAIVKYLSTRVAVMYQGKIVELAPTESLYKDPKHPYTKALLKAAESFDPSLEKKNLPDITDEEEVFSHPNCCSYYSRCTLRDVNCQTSPSLKEISEGHFVSCHKR